MQLKDLMRHVPKIGGARLYLYKDQIAVEACALGTLFVNVPNGRGALGNELWDGVFDARKIPRTSAELISVEATPDDTVILHTSSGPVCLHMLQYEIEAHKPPHPRPDVPYKPEVKADRATLKALARVIKEAADRNQPALNQLHVARESVTATEGWCLVQPPRETTDLGEYTGSGDGCSIHGSALINALRYLPSSPTLSWARKPEGADRQATGMVSNGRGAGWLEHGGMYPLHTFPDVTAVVGPGGRAINLPLDVGVLLAACSALASSGELGRFEGGNVQAWAHPQGPKGRKYGRRVGPQEVYAPAGVVLPANKSLFLDLALVRRALAVVPKGACAVLSWDGAGTDPVHVTWGNSSATRGRVVIMPMRV